MLRKLRFRCMWTLRISVFTVVKRVLAVQLFQRLKFCGDVRPLVNGHDFL